MAAPEVKADPRKIAEIQAYLRSVPKGAMKIAVRGVAEYMLGDDRRGLRHLSGYRYVSRKRAYPPSGFQSDRQRKFVMAAIREGRIKIPYTRTGGLSGSARITGSDYRLKVGYASDSAKWVVGDRTQSRHEQMVGHRKISAVVAANIKGAIRHARALVNQFLKSKRR